MRVDACDDSPGVQSDVNVWELMHVDVCDDSPGVQSDVSV